MRVKKLAAILAPAVMIGSAVAAVWYDEDYDNYMKATKKEIYVMNK